MQTDSRRSPRSDGSGSAIHGPHQGQPVLAAGESAASARAAMLLLHGRGSTAAFILSLADELSQPGFTYRAPQAASNTWYPYSFLAPLSVNEPGLSSGLAAIAAVLDQLAASDLPAERTILLGFSQGACLALEFVARNARRYGGVVGLSGGLVGPDGTPREYRGSLAGTPVFLGCGDADSHIPKERVLETADVLRELGGDVTARLYPNMGHSVNADELAFVQRMMGLLAVRNSREPDTG